MASVEHPSGFPWLPHSTALLVASIGIPLLVAGISAAVRRQKDAPFSGLADMYYTVAAIYLATIPQVGDFGLAREDEAKFLSLLILGALIGILCGAPAVGVQAKFDERWYLSAADRRPKVPFWLGFSWVCAVGLFAAAVLIFVQSTKGQVGK